MTLTLTCNGTTRAGTTQVDAKLLTYKFLVVSVTWLYDWMSSYTGRVPCYVP